MVDKIEQFIQQLAVATTASDATNHYALDSDYNAVRRENLRLYLTEMLRLEPPVLLVGEAPGYQGCRRSGIPFTSDAIMLDPPEGVQLFGLDLGFRMSPEYEKARKEPSATIVWQTIAQTGFCPLIWSAYPFHPHKKDKPLSNRAPRAGELEQGREFLAMVLELIDLPTVIAVGNNAAKSLTALEIKFVKVRHPSHGGKAEFVAGFEAVAAQYQG
ncbi:uracil-DNA glycosylase [Chloroflexota bacterium]